MSVSSTSSHDAALQVLQRAVTAIIDWASTKDGLATRNPAALQLVFDRIHLTPEQPSQSEHYHPARALNVHEGEQTPRIPYATEHSPTDQDFAALKTQILGAVQHLDTKRRSFSQLMVFLETYGSHLSWGEPDTDIALVDQAKSEAAIAAALAQNPSNQHLVLIAGDLMGVQKFIYTIASDGALKSLRARSFYLELATEEIVYRLLQALDLPRTNIIYAGASKFYLLAPQSDRTCQIVRALQDEFNHWLLQTFQKKIFLAMAVGEPFPATDLSPTAPLEGDTTRFAKYWQGINQTLSKQAYRKFDRAIDKLLEIQPSHEPCKVCRRDDTTDLQPLNDVGSPDACPVCRRMFALGGELLKAKALIRSDRPCAQDGKNCFEINNAYYRVITAPLTAEQVSQAEVAFQINCWDLTAYRNDRIFPLLLGNYGQESRQDYGFMSASEFAEESKGIKRVGYLRMDVDRLAQIFGRGLGKAHTLPRLTGLSRQMTYFFKVYLNSLAANRQENLLEAHHALMLDAHHQPSPRPNLLFIYAGGDDLFVSGTWNEVVEFAFDVYQSFRAYTGNHPEITLSGGISLSDAKYPLYQAAEDAGQAEDSAKNSGRDSLGLFGEVFKWSEWLGVAETTVLPVEDQTYLTAEEKPALLGVQPFVERLDQQLEVNQSRSFVRNLLATAQVQTQMLKLVKDQKSNEAKDIRYFLHLPKIAYTLARLPRSVRDDPAFAPVRRSLKNPYNAPYFRAIATWIELLNRV